jgi:hypothetical protein
MTYDNLFLKAYYVFSIILLNKTKKFSFLLGVCKMSNLENYDNIWKTLTKTPIIKIGVFVVALVGASWDSLFSELKEWQAFGAENQQRQFVMNLSATSAAS